MGKDGANDELGNWGGGTKSARPESVGPHHRAEQQEDPANPGLSPEEDYAPDAGGQAGTAGPGTPGEMKVNIGVKQETAGGDARPQGGSAKRDAPPLTGLAEE